ncbi:MAG: hypothetical protein UHD09_08490 [Bifidobacterium sp.]|nr:hypothetical protein [Bifidobacterium sp.]
MNLFIAVVVVVVAIVLTIMAVRFFFGAPADQAARADLRFDEPAPPRDAPVSAGDTLRNRPSDNPNAVSILTKQTAVSAVLTIIALLPMCLDAFHDSLVPDWLVNPWLQAIIITPVMFYGGYPIHTDGWSAIRRRDPNMNSLASLGAIAAYCYGLVVCVGGGALPGDMRHPYFEVTGVIITLVLFARLAMDI